MTDYRFHENRSALERLFESISKEECVETIRRSIFGRNTGTELSFKKKNHIFSLLKINGGHRIFKVYKKDKNHSAQFFLTYETKDAKEAHQIMNKLESEGF